MRLSYPHPCMHVCIVITLSRVWLSILLLIIGWLAEQGNVCVPCPHSFAPENVLARQVQPRSATPYSFSTLPAESGVSGG